MASTGATSGRLGAGSEAIAPVLAARVVSAVLLSLQAAPSVVTLAVSRRTDVDEVVDELEIRDVVGHQRHAGGIGRRGDGQVHRPSSRSAVAQRGGGKPTPFACDDGVDGKWVEAGFDNAESLCPASPLVGIVGDEQAEVQFGGRGRADGSFERARRAGAVALLLPRGYSTARPLRSSPHTGGRVVRMPSVGTDADSSPLWFVIVLG